MGKRNSDRSTNRDIEDLLSSWISERPDLDLSDFLLGIVMHRMGRMLDSSFDRMCRTHFDISAADMRVLLALRRNGKPYALRPTDLFRALLVTSGAITKQVDRLKALDLVERLPDPGYAAGFQVHLTPKGLQVADAATDELARDALLVKSLKTLPKTVRAAGEVFMYRLLAALEDGTRVERSRQMDKRPVFAAQSEQQ
ncbi:MAG TPA: MarR family transcriptional regulator [Allosphingosinicella sp.]|nr:MarR family transcriptional regulator [Allosphingosinicella sp.]